MQVNAKAHAPTRTFEGGVSYPIPPVEQLRRSVMTTMLWEDQFYEDGEAIAARIVRLVKEVGPAESMKIMFEAKEGQHLRHAPMLIAVALVKNFRLSAIDISRIITRADELGEFLSMYWKDGRCPIDHQIRKGLALAFGKFDEYQLAKYNRNKAVKLRDVLRMVRPKPKNAVQAELWRRVVKGELATPDTWEVALSAGSDKATTFKRLIDEGKLGDLAFVRNLRNMRGAGISVDYLRAAITQREYKRILPFQFIAAARYVPELETELEAAMLVALQSFEKIEGEVAILVDGSGSMAANLSEKSEISRFDAACGVAMMAREVCSKVTVYRFNEVVAPVPARRGFALRDALGTANGSTRMWAAIRYVAKLGPRRLMVVITDEQTEDNGMVNDANADMLAIINVASSEKGIGYGRGSVHISGWSENVITYLQNYLACFIHP